MTIQVFVSYSSVDKPFGEKLATDFRTREGIDVWLDKMGDLTRRAHSQHH